MAHPVIKCRMLEVALTQIFEDKRKRTELGDIEGLSRDIHMNGLINPIAVMELEGSPTLLLLAGGRRFRAVKLLGWETIACNIYPPLDPIDQRTIELAENFKRKDMTPIEEALLTKEIHDLQVQKYGKATHVGTGHRLEDTAKIIGKSTATVTQDLKIAEMALAVPELSMCKTKQEALKMIDQAVRSVNTANAVRDFEAKTGLGMIESDKGKILRAYQVGDFYELVKGIPSGTVGLVELDPVYHIELNQLKKGGGDVTYIDLPSSEYHADMVKAIKECVRVMAPNSWLLCWYAIKYHQEETAKAIQECGLTLNRLPCIWYKKTGQTLQPSTNLPSCYDTFFVARKGMPTLQRPGRPNVFECKPVISQRKVHCIERPIQLMQDILSTFISSGVSVLVPFAGSGNTLLAASNLHMPCLGFDLEKSFCDEFKLKAQNGIPGYYTSPIIGGELGIIKGKELL